MIDDDDDDDDMMMMTIIIVISAGHGLVPFKVVITNPSGNKRKAKRIFS